MQNKELSEQLNRVVVSDEMADEALSWISSSGRLGLGLPVIVGEGSDRVWAVDLIRVVLNSVSKALTKPKPHEEMKVGKKKKSKRPAKRAPSEKES